MKSLALTCACLLGLTATACVDVPPEDGTDQAALGPSIESVDQYNHYPSDRQSYQLELGNLTWAGPLAAFEYINRVVADRFPSYTLQSFKTTSGVYVFFFKDRNPARTIPGATTDRYPHHCLKIKIAVALSPTDAFPTITRVKVLPDAAGDPINGGALCTDNGEI
jgi:hypothetical protein